MTEREFPAEDGALNDVLSFAEEELDRFGCPPKTVMQLCIALEEIFVNIAHYAYPGGKGTALLGIDFDEADRIVTFRMSDCGIPFDPLEKPDPDITLSAEERQIGGLGIFMMKVTMDEAEYAYENGRNILTMKKKI